MADLTIATIRKNTNEEYRVGLTEFNGYDLATVRVWYRVSGTDDMRPGKQGVSVRLEKLPELIEAMQQAEARARTEGLIRTPQAAGA